MRSYLPFWSRSAKWRGRSGELGLTITIDSAVGAGLFAVALDLLSPTLVAGAGYTPPLLEWLWLWRLAVDVTGRRFVVARFRAVFVLHWFILTIWAGACGKAFSGSKGWRGHGDSWGTWLWLGDAAPKSKWVG